MEKDKHLSKDLKQMATKHLLLDLERTVKTQNWLLGVAVVILILSFVFSLYVFVRLDSSQFLSQLIKAAAAATG